MGDEVTKDEPLTTNPNVGGFGQELTEDETGILLFCSVWSSDCGLILFWPILFACPAAPSKCMVRTQLSIVVEGCQLFLHADAVDFGVLHHPICLRLFNGNISAYVVM